MITAPKISKMDRRNSTPDVSPESAGDSQSANFIPNNHTQSVLTMHTTSTEQHILVRLGSFFDSLLAGKAVIDTVCSEYVQLSSMKNDKLKHVFLKDYNEYSSNMLSFFSELDAFIKLAREKHSFIEYRVNRCRNTESDMGLQDLMGTSETLKRIQASFDETCNRLVLEKVQPLLDQQDKWFFTVSLEIEKLGQKEASTRCFNQANEILSMAICSGKVISKIFTAYGSSRVIDSFFAVIKEEAASLCHLISRVFKACAGVKLKDKEIYNSYIQKETMAGVMELTEFKLFIDNIGTAFGSVVVNDEYLTQGYVDFAMTNLEGKLNNYLETVKEFEVKIAACRAKTTKAREDIKTSSLKYKIDV
ncbi:hypothetical protein RchiOBHm_Chr6g0267181 [Rosa chinensis]|uniref:Uncharacterized protein n=1 Tax=Rosa chinensis TaxID=74649 RepID=A0A2P6PPV9_ROSCH|nr:uncharacterized protein LOC112173297 isoform X1 [Rosa chinensis]PRQ23964.1 hypothetical protein RchiOBHm_Chr6g0267181 [Rosa chinensis]